VVSRLLSVVLCGALAGSLGCAFTAGLDEFRRRPPDPAGAGGGGTANCSAAHEFSDDSGNRCYYFEAPLLAGWLLARELCMARGDGWDLATVSSQEEHVFIIARLSALTTQDVWVGGNDLDSPGNYVWANGEPWDYALWDSGEPSNSACTPGFEDCVELEMDPGEDGDFSDECCDEAEHFLCERP
jgi:hypothetical protein